jgi:hypothetical protein
MVKKFLIYILILYLTTNINYIILIELKLIKQNKMHKPIMFL